ncbi:MAG: hypothetical protein WCW02_01355 [Candidatus Buchananbacteria bacterium]
MNSFDINLYTFIATIAIAVLGWIFALWLQGKNIKQQHKIQIKYDIYKQFVQIHKEAQDTLSKLGASTGTPFILMESSMIPFDLKLKKQFKDVWLPYSESECVFEGEQKWTSYVQDIKRFYSEFSNKNVSLLYVFEDWTAALGSLIPAKDTLFKEISLLQKTINEQSDLLQMYSVKSGHDWRKWDRAEIQKIADNIRDGAYGIGCYLGDFMVLVHNELLAKYFKQKRLTRKTLDPKYKVLTMNGIVENVDHEKFEQMKIYKNILIALAQENLDRALPPKGTISPEYERFLRSVIAGVCPSCNNPIEVFDMEKAENSFCFNYICGHSWKGFTIQETISIKELYKIKTARPGFGWLRKVVQGWKPSGDPKLNKGVDVYMDVNREKNEYHQIVKEHQTENILHEEHEPLTEHKAKK